MVAGTSKLSAHPPPNHLTKKKFFADLDELGPWKKLQLFFLTPYLLVTSLQGRVGKLID